MLIIENGKIFITKGDDAALDVSLKIDGAPYEMQETETLTLTVREKPDVGYPVLLKATSGPGSSRVTLNHAATEMVEVGQYSADVQLLTARGERVTIWPTPEGEGRYTIENLKNFIVMPEVTNA